MARCDVTDKLNATPSRVWAEFRPDRMKRWYGPEIEVADGKPLAKGAQIRVTGRSGNNVFGYDATVTEYVENRMLAWEGADRRASYRVVFLLTPKDGGTVVLLRDEFRLRGLIGRLIEKLFMAQRVAKFDRHFLFKLKDLVEGT